MTSPRHWIAVAAAQDAGRHGVFVPFFGRLASTAGPSGVRLRATSRRRRTAAIRAFYRFAEDEKLMPANIAENLSLPRRWKRLPKALTGQEIESLLVLETPETPHSLCDQAVLELAYASGLRISELTSLTLAALARDPAYLIVRGKGGKERLAPLNDAARTAVQAYLPARKSFLPAGVRDNPWLFPSRGKSGALTPRR